jgi:hypothetical protein
VHELTPWHASLEEAFMELTRGHAGLIMTTVTARLPARARGVLTAEWIKLRSVRSTVYLAVALAMAAVVITRRDA